MQNVLRFENCVYICNVLAVKRHIKTSKMKTYNVGYSGNASRFKRFSREVVANSEREAVESIYASVLDSDYFPQEDGTILNCNGGLISNCCQQRLIFSRETALLIGITVDQTQLLSVMGLLCICSCQGLLYA